MPARDTLRRPLLNGNILQDTLNRNILQDTLDISNFKLFSTTKSKNSNFETFFQCFHQKWISTCQNIGISVFEKNVIFALIFVSPSAKFSHLPLLRLPLHLLTLISSPPSPPISAYLYLVLPTLISASLNLRLFFDLRIFFIPLPLVPLLYISKARLTIDRMNHYIALGRFLLVLQILDLIALL